MNGDPFLPGSWEATCVAGLSPAQPALRRRVGGCFCPCAGEGATLGKDIGCPQEILFLDPFIVFMWFSSELPRESWVMQMMTLSSSLFKARLEPPWDAYWDHSSPQ